MARVGTKGQVVITKEIRDYFGIEPGWVAVQRIVDDHVELRFLPPEHRESLKGLLGPYLDRTLGLEEWDEAREAAWQKAVDERTEASGGA